MKRLLVIAAAMSLVFPALALAQNPPEHKGHAGPAKAAPRAHGPARPMAHGPARPTGRPMARPARPGTHQARPLARPGHPMAHHGRPAARPGHAMGHNGRPMARPGRRGHGAHGNQFSYHGHYMNRIHGPAFHYPRGMHYRRWSVGGIFPRVFLTSSYFYSGWGALGLAAPAPGYAWVRYGPDLVLVNLSTGQVENVVYGVFY